MAMGSGYMCGSRLSGITACLCSPALWKRKDKDRKKCYIISEKYVRMITPRCNRKSFLFVVVTCKALVPIITVLFLSSFQILSSRFEIFLFSDGSR